MDKPLHKIDELFHDALNEVEVTPSDGVWTGIENNLEKKENGILRHKYTRLKYAALLLLLITATTLILTSRRNTGSENAASHTNGSTENKIPQTIQPTPAPVQQRQPANTNVSPSGKKENDNTETLPVPPSDNNKPSVTQNTVPAATVPKTTINPVPVPTNDMARKEPVVHYNHARPEKKRPAYLTRNRKQRTAPGRMVIPDKAEKLVTNEPEPKLRSQEPTRLLPEENDQPVAIAELAGISPHRVSMLPEMATPAGHFKNKTLVKFKRPKQRRFALTVYAAPELAFNALKDDETHEQRGGAPGGPRHEDRHSIKNEENHTRSFAAGVNLEFSLNRHWALQSGLAYLHKNIAVGEKQVFAERDNNGEVRFRHNNSFGVTYVNPKTGVATSVGDSATATDARVNLKYLQIPLNAVYQLEAGKWQFGASAGISFNWLTGKNASCNIKNSSGQLLSGEASVENVNARFFNANLGLQIGYALNSRFSLQLAPALQWALSPVNENSPVRSFTNAAGIRAGIRFRL